MDARYDEAFHAWWMRTAIPGEFDGWDGCDQRRWLAVCRSAFEAGLGLVEELVEENVVLAIKDCWEDNEPVCWLEDDDGRMVLTVAGPEKPEDPPNPQDVYSVRFDLLAELTEYSEPYADIGGPRSDEQREDMRERANFLRKLSEDIAALAIRATGTLPVPRLPPA